MTFGFSKKQHGQMKVTDGQLTPEVLMNRQALLNEYDLSCERTVTAILEHGNHVEVVTQKDAGQIFANTDAFVTNDEQVILTITTADCLPVYFYDVTHKAIGIAHAGWKGVLKEIALSTFRAMQSEFGSETEDLKVFLGPHLRACHFEVKDDVLQKFIQYLEAKSFSENLASNSIVKSVPSTTLSTTSSLRTPEQDKLNTPILPLEQGELEGVDSTYFINLSGIVSAQLQNSGIPESNIQISKECTFCLEDKYFSFRRDKPKEVQAQLAFMSLR